MHEGVNLFTVFPVGFYPKSKADIMVGWQVRQRVFRDYTGVISVVGNKQVKGGEIFFHVHRHADVTEPIRQGVYVLAKYGPHNLFSGQLGRGIKPAALIRLFTIPEMEGSFLTLPGEKVFDCPFREDYVARATCPICHADLSWFKDDRLTIPRYWHPDTGTKGGYFPLFDVDSDPSLSPRLQALGFNCLSLPHGGSIRVDEYVLLLRNGEYVRVQGSDGVEFIGYVDEYLYRWREGETANLALDMSRSEGYLHSIPLHRQRELCGISSR